MMTLHVVVAPAHEGPDGRGRGVENADAVAVDDLPETVRRRMIRRPLVHQHGGAVGERAIHDVAVAGHPADIRGAPVDVGILEVEDVLGRQRHPQQIAGRGVEDAFGFSGRAAGIEDEKRRFRLVRPGLMDIGGLAHDLVPPLVAPGGHDHFVRTALQHNHVLHAGCVGQRAIDACLEFDDAAPAPAPVRGDDELGLAVVHPILDRFRTESAKDHGVDHAEPRAREHGHRGFRDHRQVDGRPVAFLQTEGREHVGELADFAMKLPVRQGADIARLTLENNRRLVLPVRAQVAIETILRQIQVPSGEPLGMRQLPFENRLEGPVPQKIFFRLPRPEFLWSVDRLRIELTV